jgi:hypothetical protein
MFSGGVDVPPESACYPIGKLPGIPLQLALLIPFIRAGEILFHSARLPLSLKQIVAMIKANAWHAVKVLWNSTMQAVVWVLIAPPAIYVLYRVLAPLLRKLALQTGASKAVNSK